MCAYQQAQKYALFAFSLSTGLIAWSFDVKTIDYDNGRWRQKLVEPLIVERVGCFWSLFLTFDGPVAMELLYRISPKSPCETAKVCTAADGDGV